MLLVAFCFTPLGNTREPVDFPAQHKKEHTWEQGLAQHLAIDKDSDEEEKKEPVVRENNAAAIELVRLGVLRDGLHRNMETYV